MERRTAYRQATSLSLERRTPDDVEVAIELPRGIRIERSAFGQMLIYREHLPYGQTLAAALELGWCQVVPEEEEADD
jgi:hypothetical protein